MKKAVERKLLKAYEKELQKILLYPALKTRKQLRIWNDRFVKGMEIPEIAFRLGTTKRAVHKMLQRIRKQALKMAPAQGQRKNLPSGNVPTHRLKAVPMPHFMEESCHE